MIGAIAGDIVGSVFERRPIKTTDFNLINFGCRFTDDTVLIIAVADAILKKVSYEESIRNWGLKNPNAGYGGSFDKWLYSSNPKPYNSWGNGSAMRVIPVGYAFHNIEDVLLEAERTSVITHDHPE
ncbi:MAG TPA: ADP-ribosylglycohydrolase family protein, partial [Anditalea sp.]|nr:ADP-ribosylglycohydrolase family protein [Anditalea sp.]